MHIWVRRSITGFIFIAIMFCGLLGGRLAFLALFALVNALCFREFLLIVLDKNIPGYRTRFGIAMLLGVAPFAISAAVFYGGLELWLSLTLILPLLFLFFVFELFNASPQPINNIAHVALGILYVSIPFALLNWIAFGDHNFQTGIIIGLLLLTWMNDSAAFVFGSLLGRNPLFPRVSPKKTWEGAVGGLVFAAGFAFALQLWFPMLTLANWIILALIVTVFGTLGDLIESLLKRSYQLKDSGALLPGHGGMLDRFDGFIFMLPFATAYLAWIK